MVERQTRDCSSTVLSPRSFHLVPLVRDARGGLLFGGLEICRGARAVHFRLFSLCYPVLAISHLPSFTGRAESPAALQLPLLSLLWTILCKLHRCLRILNYGQPVRSDALFKRQPLPLSSCGGRKGVCCTAIVPLQPCLSKQVSYLLPWFMPLGKLSIGVDWSLCCHLGLHW